MGRPAVSSGEVVLREVRQADLPILFEHQRDPEATRMAAFPAREEGPFLEHWTRILADPDVITRAVVVDGRVVGNVVSFPRDGRREVGYWIERDSWGRGVATHALTAFLREVGVRPLHAWVARHNGASRRVLERCGFTLVPGEQDDGEAAGGAEGLVLELR